MAVSHRESEGVPLAAKAVPQSGGKRYGEGYPCAGCPQALYCGKHRACAQVGLEQEQYSASMVFDSLVAASVASGPSPLKKDRTTV